MIGESISKRYRSSYRVSKWIDAIGELLKAAGLLTGAGLFYLFDKFVFRSEPFQELVALLGGILKASRGTAEEYLGAAVFVLCVLIFFAFWLLGTIISAIGQTLKAVLDTAVNTSPILSYDEKVRALK